MTPPRRLRIRRVYDAPAPADGARILVDRLWPRGLKKEKARLDLWAKEVAPSDGLRRRFGHDPARWEEFRRRYVAELEARPETWRPILDRLRAGTVTLVYAASDPVHNNAAVLKEFLEKLR